MKNKKLTFQMNFKSVQVEEGKIKIKGFASTPTIDRYDDIVQPIAFQTCMAAYMNNPIVLLGHNSDKPLGVVTEYNISPLGLEVTAELTNDIENTFKNIQDEVLRGFSIGFICKSWNIREEDNRCIREITELDLIEISVVTTPANPTSLFTMAKSLKSFFMEVKKFEMKEAGETEEAIEAAVGKVEEIVEVIGDAITEVTETVTEAVDKIEEIVSEEKGNTPNLHCKSCTGGVCKGVMKKDLPEDDGEPMHCECCDSKSCGGMNKSSAKDITPEMKDAPEVETPEQIQTTVEEAPATEEVATPETVEVPAEDKSEVVKADEKVETIPVTISEEQIEGVKSSILTQVKEMIETMQKEHLEEVKGLKSALEAKNTDFERVFTEFKALEDDILNIEIKRPGTFANGPVKVSKALTYGQLLGIDKR